jgi:hypothetical protein
MLLRCNKIPQNASIWYYKSCDRHGYYRFQLPSTIPITMVALDALHTGKGNEILEVYFIGSIFIDCTVCMSTLLMGVCEGEGGVCSWAWQKKRNRRGRGWA